MSGNSELTVTAASRCDETPIEFIKPRKANFIRVPGGRLECLISSDRDRGEGFGVKLFLKTVALFKRKGEKGRGEGGDKAV